MFLLTDVVINCGGRDIVMNSLIPELTSTLFNLIKFGVPVLLIFFGMLDLGKAVMAQKEDEIKKGQQTFVKRLIAAVLVFLVFFIVQLVFNLVTTEEDASLWNCVDCIISNNCGN